MCEKGVCVFMINAVGTSNPYQSLIKQRYDEIYKHEQAHKSAAGSLGGAIVIEKNAQGIPVGGHVDILMPVLDKNNPDKTIKHADKVIKSAMAPSDPSGQDYKVAAEARHIKNEAISAKHNQKADNNNKPSSREIGNKLNLIA